MYDVEFTFNGVTSQEMNLYNVRVNQSDVTHLFNAAKQLTTAKAFYGDRNIITNIDTEPLTFSLTFTSLEGSFTISRIREIFKWFDVNDYAPLSFGSNPDFYYNVMPLTSQQDLLLILFVIVVTVGLVGIIIMILIRKIGAMFHKYIMKVT
jgi:phage-related protein